MCYEQELEAFVHGSQDLKKHRLSYSGLPKQALRPVYFGETDFLSVDAFQFNVDVFSVHRRNLERSVFFYRSSDETRIVISSEFQFLK